MFLAVVAKRAVLSYAVDGDKASTELHFECVASEESGVLEVGENHVFVAEDKLGGHRDRSQCAFRIWMRRRSRLSAESVAKLGLNEEKIGELGFFPSIEPGPGDFFLAGPATLEAFIYVSDQVFAEIATSLNAGRKTEMIYVDIKREGSIAYGWEPDGSRMVWKISNAKEPSYVDVTGLKVRISLFE